MATAVGMLTRTCSVAGTAFAGGGTVALRRGLAAMTMSGVRGIALLTRTAVIGSTAFGGMAVPGGLRRVARTVTMAAAM